MFNALKIIIKAHTVWRVKAAFHVATFPLLTPQADDPLLWKLCGRLALKGLFSRDPRCMSHFLQAREQLIKARNTRVEVPGWKPPGNSVH